MKKVLLVNALGIALLALISGNVRAAAASTSPLQSTDPDATMKHLSSQTVSANLDTQNIADHPAAAAGFQSFDNAFGQNDHSFALMGVPPASAKAIQDMLSSSTGTDDKDAAAAAPATSTESSDDESDGKGEKTSKKMPMGDTSDVHPDDEYELAPSQGDEAVGVGTKDS